MFGSIGPMFWARESRDLFSQIPNDSRDRFVKRLNLLIKYQRTHSWEKMYSLLYSGIKRDETIEHFLKRQEHWYKELPENRILNFIPHLVRGPENAATREWTIFGCITRSEHGHSGEYQGMVSAYYEGGDWFFSEPSIITGIDGPATECDGLTKQKETEGGKQP